MFLPSRPIQICIFSTFPPAFCCEKSCETTHELLQEIGLQLQIGKNMGNMLVILFLWQGIKRPLFSSPTLVPYNSFFNVPPTSSLGAGHCHGGYGIEIRTQNDFWILGFPHIADWQYVWKRGVKSLALTFEVTHIVVVQSVVSQKIETYHMAAQCGVYWGRYCWKSSSRFSIILFSDAVRIRDGDRKLQQKRPGTHFESKPR